MGTAGLGNCAAREMVLIISNAARSSGAERFDRGY